MKTGNWLGAVLVVSLGAAVAYAAGWFDSAPPKPPEGPLVSVAVTTNDGCAPGTVTVTVTNHDPGRVLKSAWVTLHAYTPGDSHDWAPPYGDTYTGITEPKGTSAQCFPLSLPKNAPKVQVTADISNPAFYEKGEFIPRALPDPAPPASGRR